MIEHKGYYIQSSWEARAETPDDLAARFLRLIDSLKQIDPVFNLWTCGAKRPKKFETVRDRYAEEIAAGVTRDDWGEAMPFEGYWFGAITRDMPNNRSFAVRCHAGSTVNRRFTNDVLFTTSYGAIPDQDVISYRIFRSALLAIIATWDPIRAAAYSDQLNDITGSKFCFREGWIQYLCPWLAQKITPPATALVEHLPNGGLLMSATTETFKADNPVHLSVARDMAAAMASLNKLPWPSDNKFI
jgi:hypothetical protein